MIEKECEHEWDDSQDIDSYTDLVDLKLEYVQIKVRCRKCGKVGLTSAELEWSTVFWDALYLEV